MSHNNSILHKLQLSFSCYYPLGKDRHERFYHAWRSKRLPGSERSKPHLDRWRRDNPRTQKNCSQPTNEAWAEYWAMLEHYAMQGGGREHSTDERSMGRVYRAILEHYAMQGGGRGHSTDWRLTASMLCPKRNYPRRTGSWRGLWGICRGKDMGWEDRLNKSSK